MKTKKQILTINQIKEYSKKGLIEIKNNTNLSIDDKIIAITALKAEVIIDTKKLGWKWESIKN
jgi:hypothetical protein